MPNAFLKKNKTFLFIYLETSNIPIQLQNHNLLKQIHLNVNLFQKWDWNLKNQACKDNK